MGDCFSSDLKNSDIYKQNKPNKYNNKYSYQTPYDKYKYKHLLIINDNIENSRKQERLAYKLKNLQISSASSDVEAKQIIHIYNTAGTSSSNITHIIVSVDPYNWDTMLAFVNKIKFSHPMIKIYAHNRTVSYRMIQAFGNADVVSVEPTSKKAIKLFIAS